MAEGCTPEKVLFVKELEKCTGCGICELACSLTRSGECRPSASCIKVIKNEEMDVAVPTVSAECDLCGACAAWCPTGVLTLLPIEEALKLRRAGRPLGGIPALVLPGK